ncbi:MAG TPA: 30S ribosomal protein S16 [Oligoflexia bacterium]|nr:30S ribosomal protein S16 [Oligoflexia bacterium]HMP27910.1 30S ribosomal protein S16 [Oligoflexia bacterium]
MAVVLRLTRKGAKSKPFYRIVACNKQSPRDGKFLEVIGTYNPLTNPATITFNKDLAQKWIVNGAKPSRKVGDIIKKELPNFLEERVAKKISKIQAKRKARKARAKK